MHHNALYNHLKSKHFALLTYMHIEARAISKDPTGGPPIHMIYISGKYM